MAAEGQPEEPGRVELSELYAILDTSHSDPHEMQDRLFEDGMHILATAIHSKDERTIAEAQDFIGALLSTYPELRKRLPKENN